jgi:two-component system sensor histidine kinase KdpD
VAKVEGLPAVPRRKINYRGVTFEEMDTDAILARRPEICLVDELPHSNVPGCERNKRWQDVVVLLDAAIDVLTTMNIQHLESLNDQVREITGITVRETVPDWLIQQANEMVMIDLTPRALLHRLERGVVYKGEQARRALQNFFREPTLVALREMALREAAHAIEHRIAGTEPEVAPAEGISSESIQHEKILVCLTADPKTAMVTRRAKRVSDFLHAKCFAVVVRPTNSWAHAEREAIEKHLNFARNQHIETFILQGNDPATTILNFARQNEITQIFVTRPKGSSRIPFLARDPVQKLIDMAKDMQVVIVSDRDPMRNR